MWTPSFIMISSFIRFPRHTLDYTCNPHVNLFFHREALELMLNLMEFPGLVVQLKAAGTHCMCFGTRIELEPQKLLHHLIRKWGKWNEASQGNWLVIDYFLWWDFAGMCCFNIFNESTAIKNYLNYIQDIIQYLKQNDSGGWLVKNMLVLDFHSQDG